jgi:ferredoxin--NADP+ reductase/benzoate/toluate 1,2-dioxygenase reductase subunit
MPAPILRFHTTINNIENLNHDNRLFFLHKPANFVFEPGQFLTLLLSIDGKTYRRPYSIASGIDEEYIMLCIKRVEGGIGTSYLWKMKIGDTLSCMGPLGVFTLTPAPQHVLIGTGTGLAPFRSMVMSYPSKSFHVISSNRYEPLFASEFKNRCTIFTPTLTRPDASWNGETGRVQQLLEKIELSLHSHYYLCGLNEMIKSVRDILMHKNVPQEHIHVERYD